MDIDKLDAFTRAYMECALWASTAENAAGTCNLDEIKSVEDLAPETMNELVADCIKFQSENRGLLDAEYVACEETRENRRRLDDSSAGHDFWLTRNHHGAGFWDGDWPVSGKALDKACKVYGETNLYIGDDGLIYAS